MSNSSLVNYTKISPNKTSPRNHAIDTVTIHCVVGQCSVESLGNVFAAPSKQASSNYGIGYDGKIGMYVEEKDRSWCSSSSQNDNRAITIEVASDTYHPYAVTDAAYKSLINLLTDICQRNGIKELKWKADKSLIGQVDKQNMTVHRWFANKSCPGEYLYSRHGKIAAEVNERLNKNSGSDTPNPTPTKPIEPTKPSVISVGDLVSITSGAKYYNGADVPNWVEAKKWYVASISGDRAIINKSDDGKNAINSAIDTKYLKVEKTATKEPTPDDTIKKGDLVSIVSGAKYYNGIDIPDWVEAKKWYVDSISGDRAIINKSEDGNNAINSAVNVKYLKLAKKTSDLPYMVRVEIDNLNIRKGPGMDYEKTGLYTGKGVFTIVEVKSGNGSKSGWGRLKSGSGWISLDFAKKV